MIDNEHRAIRVKALLDAERADGYADCYRAAVARVLHGAASAVGTRAITKREESTLRTTVAGMIGDMERHVHGPLAETLKAEAVRDVEDALARLGRGT